MILAYMAALFAWHVSFYFIICLASFISFHSVSFHFILFHSVSFCFNPFHYLAGTFHSVSFHFIICLARFIPFHSVSLFFCIFYFFFIFSLASFILFPF